MTRDIDVVVEVLAGAADRLCDLFEGDFHVDRHAARAAVVERGVFNPIHVEGIVKVDFIVRKDSECRRTEFTRRRRAFVEGSGFFVVVAEDLIISKLDWARDTHSEMQMVDVRAAGPRHGVPGSDRMSDTRLEIAERYRRLLLARSGEERLKMGSSMHATALALVRASVLERDPQASPGAVRRAVFLRVEKTADLESAIERALAALALGRAALLDVFVTP